MTATKEVHFRLDTPLSSLEVKTLVQKGAKLFEKMFLTHEAEIYLTDNPDLAEAVKKW